MNYYFAPMEGITGAVFRRTHHEFFPGIDKYFMPFITPTTQEKLTPRQKRDVLPEYNEGVPAAAAAHPDGRRLYLGGEHLASLGYAEVNLNLGCPSGTVTAKGKGAGFLAHPDELDRFLDAVFSACTVPISIKTRLGVHDPVEFEALLEIYSRYPVTELTIHPRVRQDFYKGRVREDAFAAALPHCPMPVCYNGDLVSERGIRETIERYTSLSGLMLGRSLRGDPSLVTRVRGGERADSARLQAFHDALFARYCDAFGDSRIAVLRMKELWFYFETCSKTAKSSRNPSKRQKMPRNSNVRRRRSFARVRYAGMSFRRGSARRNAVRLRAETDYAQYPIRQTMRNTCHVQANASFFLCKNTRKCRE